jgi:hypothetical protein
MVRPSFRNTQRAAWASDLGDLPDGGQRFSPLAAPKAAGEKWKCGGERVGSACAAQVAEGSGESLGFFLLSRVAHDVRYWG